MMIADTDISIWIETDILAHVLRETKRRTEDSNGDTHHCLSWISIGNYHNKGNCHTQEGSVLTFCATSQYNTTINCNYIKKYFVYSP